MRTVTIRGRTVKHTVDAWGHHITQEKKESSKPVASLILAVIAL